MQKIAVFGGAGFLGQFLVNELLRRKYKVSVFDILPITDPDTDLLSQFNIDICDRAAVEAAICNGQFDMVYNLAGFANLDVAIKFPYRTLELNILGNLNILDACVLAKVKRFIYASSTYAMNDKGSFYGISKLTSEKIIEEYALQYELPFTILRYGSVYAEKSFDNNYIFNLVEKAIKTKKIVHGGDGNEVREYIHASDVAKLSVDVIETEQFINEHVIFTGTEKIKRSELFEMIREILGNQISIEYLKNEYDHHYKYTPYSYTPTLSKKLVANPHIDMGQGLLECIREVYKQIQEQ